MDGRTDRWIDGLVVDGWTGGRWTVDGMAEWDGWMRWMDGWMR